MLVIDRTRKVAVKRMFDLRGAGIRVVAQVSPTAGPWVEKAIIDDARTQGYIALEADCDLPEAARRRFWHRHVLLLQRGPLSSMGARWIRELSQASPRAHAVLVVPLDNDTAVCVAEAGPSAQAELRPLPPAPVRGGARRASNDRSSRRAANVRALRATLEHTWRLNQRSSSAAAYVQLVADSRPDDPAQATRLVATGQRVLDGVKGLSIRSHVVGAMAEVWLVQAEFELATAALAAVEVECTLTGVSVPPWIRGRQLEIACWQGRWDDVDRLTQETPVAHWHAVADVARRDEVALKRLQAAVDRVDREPQRDESTVGPARWRDALGLEALRYSGHDVRAAAWIRRKRSRPRGPAEDLLWRWVTRDTAVSLDRGLEQEIRRRGAEGIRRWGIGRTSMKVWAGVSSLLQDVQEADDAVTALRRGCQWAREYTGVDLVAIVGLPPATVLVCEPDGRRAEVGSGLHDDGDPGVLPEGDRIEPVRYGGCRIGTVVMRGRPRDGGEAGAVATALATACAPAVRARLDDLLVSHAGVSLAGDLLGVSPAMCALRDQVARAAASSYPVLIEGESGTGKELVARAVHRLSARRDRRWAPVNCAALTDELLESELFGHSRGAFTGAVSPRAGLLEDADGGTLFLDEVAELSPRAQAKLLRVLQEREVRRVGENRSRQVDVRVVTATNRSLVAAAREGVYRQDLVFRLAVIRLHVPALRQRLEDVPLLAHSFWRAAAAHVSTRAMLGPDAVAALCRYDWPGNVRELQNVIAALAVAGPTRGRIGGRSVDSVLSDRSGGPLEVPVSLAAARQATDRKLVIGALARHAGRRTAAARELGVSRQGLAKLITRLEVSWLPEGVGSGDHPPA